MISRSDDKIFRIEDYIEQIDELVKSLPTFGEFVEQNYSDENIDTCVDLLYELIEDMGAKETHMYSLDSNMKYISFKPSNSSYFRLGHIKDRIYEIDMDKFKENKQFKGIIGLGFDPEESDNDSKPCFVVEYNGVDEVNDTELFTFSNVTDTLATFFDLDLKRRKNYPKNTKIVQITAF